MWCVWQLRCSLTLGIGAETSSEMPRPEDSRHNRGDLGSLFYNVSHSVLAATGWRHIVYAHSYTRPFSEHATKLSGFFCLINTLCAR